ncbi:acyltransferase family protein [Krasilnikovia sp. MM14-A1004]|uniref:acyltransferase family protein n=1 Tax=Krasilnikovia sp. MM14-A1004 TaxID=3373541 RepID=UPI00399C8B6E
MNVALGSRTPRVPGPRAADLAALTPASRDRYVDLLRVVSLAAVVFGHWLMAVPVVGPGGSVEVGNVLSAVPALRPLTWLLQVMPVFFLVGGFAHGTGWASVRRRGGRYADFTRARASRLLRPTAVFLAVWLALATAAGLAGRDAGLVRLALRTVTQPLWFLGVYLALVALTPPLWALHRRLGRWAPAVPVALLAATAVVDVLRFTGGHTGLATLNLLLVWAGVHQLGFLYADGTLQRGGLRLGGWLAGGGLLALVALTGVGPYPVSMVGVPGESVSNMSPPTLALAAHAVWLTGLVLLLRGPATRWLARVRVWRAVVAANGLAMTAFLWHLGAAFAVVGVVAARGWDLGAPGGPLWWLTRPLWLGAAALFTAVLVSVFRRFDAPRPPAAPGGGHPLRSALGMVLCTLGVLAVSTVGFGGLLAGRTATLLVLPVTAPAALALLAAGAMLLRPAPGAQPTVTR